MERNKSIKTRTLRQGLLRSNPLTGSPIIEYPACGTRSISMRPSAPTKRISQLGSNSRNAFAILTAGKICPPVPPPEIRYFMSDSD